jgi:hypothetical protein
MEKAIEDWEKTPQVDQTLDNAITHFTEANEYRLNKLSKTTKEVLVANPAINELQALLATTRDLLAKATADKATDKDKRDFVKQVITGWGYCWTHGVCKGSHNSSNCNTPAEGHQKTANINDRKGGSLSIMEPRPPHRNGNRRRGNENVQNQGN